MTPQEYIAEMGAGWNLGNTYECHNGKIANAKYRYWSAGGNWKCSVKHGDSVISTTTSVTVFKSGASQEFSITFKYPQDGLISISLTHPKIVTGLQNMQFAIKSVKVDSTVKEPLTSTLTFPKFTNSTSTLDINCSTLFNDKPSEGTNITITMEINGEPLNLYPTDDEEVLSNIRKYYCTFAIDSWGSRRVKEAHVKAVATAGFKSIRIPITWKDRLDPLDDKGHVHVDTEFLDHIAEIINLFHSYGLLVLINMHHDDQDWLKTGKYLTDPTVSTRYKDIWTQVATYFKDYGDWLSFASNNETRNDNGVWEGANVLDTDIYGLMMIQKDFYDIVRNSGGNNTHRICFYPTYAAKQGAIKSTYRNPNNSEDTGMWGFPYNDPYGIAEVHPYNNAISTIQSDNKKVRSRGLPTVYGEYGVNASQTHDKQTCINQAYMVAYAKYYNMGTFLWDDNGGMQILRRDNCKMDNSSNFDKLWNGSEFNFIQAIVASANLKQKEILLNNRRTSCYMGDKVEVCLDTKENVILSNEGSSTVALDGSSFIAGQENIDNLLAISYIGEYNTIDVTVDEPENWVTTIYDNTYDGWERINYSATDVGILRTIEDTERYSLFLPITTRCVKVSGNKSAFANESHIYIREYDSSKKLSVWNAVEIKDNEVYMLSPKTAYVAIMFRIKSKYNPSIPDGAYIKVEQRDEATAESKDKTINYVDSIVNYNNYNVSIYRTIEAAGGMEYTIDMGMDSDVYIIEYNGDKIEHEGWYKNGDTFTTNLFTKTIRIEIVVPNNKITQLVNNFNSKSLAPKLRYTDYDTHVSQYNEIHSAIDLGGGGNVSPVLNHTFCSVGNKLLTYNGSYVIK